MFSLLKFSMFLFQHQLKCFSLSSFDISTFVSLFSDSSPKYVSIIVRYNELQKNANKFFDDLIIEAPLLTLKPEYSMYIKKYGPPVNGIFESDKIAEILDTLK